ncbi:MAG TPA: hydrogen gas-evolving membrane-bound hydrogenase subunit E, partial [Actinomycetota bacterium]|nr:hydrogen gas-evolving membrane-bound hydrogenase subunit E [Actinomycetota bacterium]
SGIGTLIFGYATAYFSKPKAGLGRFASALTGFAGSMLGLVLADNLLALYLFWELTSVTSYLLIGFEDRKAAARAAALQAILITGAGGLAMLGGFVILGQQAGTFQMSALLSNPPGGSLTNFALVLVLLGALTKSAQVPFHSWLPGAMAAPTPVSAYLHSATMVKAGVYLVARFAPAFADAPPWRPVAITVGLATMLIGGMRALRQHDLKLLLAHGTTSQLGFLVVLLGLGLPEATMAGCVMLLAHGFFKACLFMVVGIVDHQAHTRDFRRLDRLGLSPSWRPTMAVTLAAAASMAGVPLLFGFIGKEAAYEALVHGGAGPADRWILAGVVAGSMLTFAYSGRLVRGLVSPASFREDHASGAPAPGPSFLAPAVVLACVSIVLGVLPGPLSDFVSAAARSLDPAVEPVHLALWHGFGTALWLSVVTLVVGGLLVAGWQRVEAGQNLTPEWVPSADGGYLVTLKGINKLADRTVAIVQSGSLPAYIGTILFTLMALPGYVLLRDTDLPELPPVASSASQLVVAVLIFGAAVGAARVTQRIHAVLFLGAVGYGMALLFVLHGAPDLALTQVLIETLSVAIFVLVLRRLPASAVRSPWRLGQVVRAAFAVGIGLFVTVFALVAGAARTEDPISTGFLERALPEGGGRNVVNVILVDFRGIDTVGEITVLAVAAVGIVSLARAAREAIGGRTLEGEDS